MLKNVMSRQVDNIVVGKVKCWNDTVETDCYNLYNLPNAMIELKAMFPDMKHILESSWTSVGEEIYSDKLSFNCSVNGLRIMSRQESLFMTTVIPWDCILSIEFDTFLDHSNLVGIWIYTTWNPKEPFTFNVRG